MCEPNFNNLSLLSKEDHSSDDDDDVFLDAKDVPITNNHSETVGTNVFPIKYCSGATVIDLQALPIESKPKRVVENAFIVDDPFLIFPNGRRELSNKVPPRQLSIWSLVKEFVGRDLTKVTMPVIMNEPLSLLHKFIECFEYPNLIQKMIDASDPVERLEYCAANYAIFQSSHSYRTYKPFNPLLGETYELRNDEKGFVFIAEQVSHHPPISAFFIQLPRFRGYGTFQVNIKFWGNSCDTILDGMFYFEFLDSNGQVENVITFKSPCNSARNIIIGNIWIEKHGMVEMISHSTGHKLFLNFKKKSWFNNRDQNAIEGIVCDAKGKELRCLYGHWTQEIWSCSPETYRKIKANPRLGKGPDSKLLARAIGRLPNAEDYFNIPQFSICLNEFCEGMYLPRTDNRFRPDMRYLEEGNFEKASAEKHRLEEKQRAARRLREAKGEKWVPLWFDLKRVAISNRDEWLFNYKYFDQNFEKCPDIY